MWMMSRMIMGTFRTMSAGYVSISCARRFTCVICIDSRPSTCMIFFPVPPRLRSLNVMVGAWRGIGSLRSRVTTAQRIRHAITRNCLALPLLASKDGRRGLADQIAILQVDEVLKRDAGKSYQAEITLFVVSPEARGMGVGRKLFNHMLGVFRNAGMNEYFLFTDTTCDYGFYDYRGLTRKAERTVRRDSFTQGGLEDGALSFFLYEGRC